MDVADRLCERLFSWLDRRKRFAEQLKALAKELEENHYASTVTKTTGSAIGVAGGLSLAGAGLLTFATGGLATPILCMTVAGTAASVAGTAVNIGASMVEKFCESKTMKKAKEIMEEDEAIGKDIQRLLQQLTEECEEGRDSYAGHTTENRVMGHILWALARSRGLRFPHSPELFSSLAVSSMATLALVSTVNFSAKFSKNIVPSILADIGLIGLKKTAQGAAKVAGGMVGLALSLPELVDSTIELVKGKHVTEASEALRNAAKSISEAQATLREKLEAIQKMLEEMSRVRQLISSLKKYSHTLTSAGEELLRFVRERCNDPVILGWLADMCHAVWFVNLVQYFHQYLLQKLEEEEERIKKAMRPLDIVIIAHGSTMTRFMPARCLMPLVTVEDVILYSPWNCVIDANVAYGIATGSIQPQDRVFSNAVTPNEAPFHFPRILPQHWNSMSSSPYPEIPWIILHPVKPREPVWRIFVELMSRRGVFQPANRILIPYIVPDGVDEKLFPSVPLFVLTLALSIVLWPLQVRAKIHLAACLGFDDESRCSKTQMDITRCVMQYAYTVDHTMMSSTNVTVDNKLFRALRSMFG
ncbi:hypothetical protein MATL_G00260780 [Megalops atlanticus]|uniref:Apolipoprotein L3 n=1 Tax=Megalops atlanticus TaxID=7932 RepID=A0A9D3P8U7_MEGAT|nr:hypothetical protein MATL_G00260780 [Megalops atlanticus]